MTVVLNWVEDPLRRWANRPARIYVTLFAAYLIAAVVYYRRLLTAYFTADEVDILANADARGFWEILTRYDVSANNFVPLLLASFKLDWMLFEWWLPGYRLHTILASVVAAMLIVALLRHWCGWTVSILGGYVFLLSVDTAALVGYMASRHYLEGLIPALVAVLLVLRYRRSPSWTVLGGAVACYLVAAFFKEVFVPLPLVLLVLPGLCRKRRVTLFAAFALAAAAYFLYRRAMMGRFVGGYGGGGYNAVDVIAYMVRAWPWFSGWMLFGTKYVAWWLMIPANVLLIAALWVSARTSRMHLLCLAALLIVAVGPVALVLGTPQVKFIDEASHYCQRFTFPVFVVLLAASAFALERIDRRLAAAALAILLLVGGVCGRAQVRSWSHDGMVTRKSAVAFEQWWDKRVVYATDIPRQLHLGLQKIWTRRADQSPDRPARVIAAVPGGIARGDPILNEVGVVFVEELRTGETILTREEFIRRYATPAAAEAR